MNDLFEQTQSLMHHLALNEEPFGIFYQDCLPEKAYGPKEGSPISRELEEAGKLDWPKMTQQFSCFLGNIWIARKKKAAAFISHKHYGCMGGAFYTGTYAPYLNTIPCYVSTGIPGTPMQGERYMPSPEAMHAFLTTYPPRKAPKECCIAQPLSLFNQGEEPELIVFFARPEVVCGLYTLLTFATGNVEVMATVFGSGCGHITSWPFYFMGKGEEKAVLGTFDPSARKFLKTDELTVTIPLGLYKKMLAAMPQSVFGTHVWETVKTKIKRSNTKWGEGEA